MHCFETKEEKNTRFEKKMTIYCEEKENNFISIITFLQNVFIEPGEFLARTWANVMARVLVSSPHLPSWASVPNIKQSNYTGWLLRWVLILGTSGDCHFKKSYLHCTDMSIQILPGFTMTAARVSCYLCGRWLAESFHLQRHCKKQKYCKSNSVCQQVRQIALWLNRREQNAELGFITRGLSETYENPGAERVSCFVPLNWHITCAIIE